MQTYILIYESFVQFEVVLASYFMKTKGEVKTVAVDENEVNSYEGFLTLPHTTIDKVNYEDVDLFIIPGGNPNYLFRKEQIYKFLKSLNEKDTIIGAICAGPLYLAKSGILEGRKYTTTLVVDDYEEFEGSNFENKNVVIDKNIITAKANGYVDFAIELAKKMNIFEDKEDLKETISFFKYFKN